MLANLLSRKSFLVQIILGIVFILFFVLINFGITIDDQIAISDFLFVLTVIVSCLFFNTTKLIKFPGISIWYFLIWALAFSGITSELRITLSLLVCTVLIWRLLYTVGNLENRNSAFEIGILLSISSFFWPPTVFLGGFLLFNYLYVQALNLRTFLLFILGFILPIAGGVQILYLLNETNWIGSYQTSFCLNFWTAKIYTLIPIGVLLLLAWFDHVSNSSIQEMTKRHQYFLLFLYFINLLIILILYAGENFNTLMFLGLPLTVFLTRLTQYRPTEFQKNLLLWIYLIVMLAFHFREELKEIYLDLLGNVTFQL